MTRAMTLGLLAAIAATGVLAQGIPAEAVGRAETPVPAAQEASSGGEAKWLTVRMLPDVSPDSLERIAELTEPQYVTIEAGTSVAHFLKREYGNYNERLDDLFRAANPGLEGPVITATMRVRLPPAPRFGAQSKGVVGPSESVSEVAQRSMGVSGPGTLTEIQRLNPNIANIAQVRAEQPVILPYSTRWASYRIRPERMGEVDAFIAKSVPADGGLLAATVSEEIGLVEALETADLAAEESAACAAADGRWGSPLKLDFLEELLAKGAMRDPVTVAVIDTGIDEEEQRLPLWVNSGEEDIPDGQDNELNGYFDDLYGADVPAGGGFPTSPEEPRRFNTHGPHVAGILAGAPSGERMRDLLAERLQLMILKVTETAAGSTRIDAASVSNAIAYAASNGARIANLSIESSDKRIFDARVPSTPGMLFVVAAGNGKNGEGHDLEGNAGNLVYPAAMGGNENAHVLTVGAALPEGGLTGFSNWSAHSVDIVAPGLCIESLSSNGETSVFSGTSQAAPMVSMVAALLMNRGMRSPREIKARIIKSSDYHESLKGLVLSEGQLNAEKALRFDKDLLELVSDGSLVAGSLVEPSTVTLSNGEPRATRNIMKILPQEPGAPDGWMRVTYRDARGRIAHDRAPRSFESVVVKIDGALHVMRAIDVADIILKK